MAHLSRRDVLATLASIVSAAVPNYPGHGDGETEVLTGVVDRIEEAVAVVLVERDGETVDERRLPLDLLSDAAREPGAVLELTIERERVTDAQHDATATERRRSEAEAHLDELAADRSDEGGE